MIASEHRADLATVEALEPHLLDGVPPLEPQDELAAGRAAG